MKYRTLMITSALALLALVLIALTAMRGPRVGAQVQPTSHEELNKKVADLEKSVSDLRKSDEEGLKAISALSLTDPPVGTIMAFAGEFPPMRDKTMRWTEEELGWMTCDGRELNTDTYKELFRAIGPSWGKKGDNEFYLPNLGGRFLRGIDTGQNLDPDKASRTDRNGRIVGPVIGSLQEHALEQHQHGNDPHDHGYTDKWQKDEMSDDAEDRRVGHFEETAENRRTTKESITITGVLNARISSETRPKNAYVHYIIKFKSSRGLAP